MVLGGAVQGVGLRPFVYRLATHLELSGHVRNSSDGVVIEVEGDTDRLAAFTTRLSLERPAAACVTSEVLTAMPPAGARGFTITGSDAGRQHAVSMLNDLATCTDCVSEILDPANRRHGYAFTNCTACGPRFTITGALPYDRATTTMGGFVMCEACQAEYDDPADRRFHAQPNACPDCGPHLSTPIAIAAQALLSGSIVALKGVGGFQLMCDARNDTAVARLRTGKLREAKPFAVMMPSLDRARRYCRIGEAEAAALTSPAAPIVLLTPTDNTDLSPAVGGRSPFVGVMLPYSPIHHLLLRACEVPLVATSGNAAGEPIAIAERDARQRLGGIADLFVTHDRPIARPCDDSVVRVGAHGPTPVRRARGYAPLPIHVGVDLPRALAVGGHLKNTVAIGLGRNAIVSQHLGDLDTMEARAGFEAAIADLCQMHDFTPDLVVADLHPDYASTRWAATCGHPVHYVQHHEAHVAACAAENGVSGTYLGVAWDGTGYGHDGTIWGGEFFLVEDGCFSRLAHLRTFPLWGGDAAARDGWRVALALEWAAHGASALDGRTDAALIDRVLTRRINVATTSSVGRLFDAVAAATGIADRSRFEGEAAMALEAAADSRETGLYPFGDGIAGDWEPLMAAIGADLARSVSPSVIAARFHRTLIGWISRVAQAAGIGPVVLSGGAFQNALLADGSTAALIAAGHAVHTHHRVPANDGGLSLGQLMLARRGAPLE